MKFKKDEKIIQVKRTPKVKAHKRKIKVSNEKSGYESAETWEEFIDINKSLIEVEVNKIKKLSKFMTDDKNRNKFFKKEMRDLNLRLTNIWAKTKPEKIINKNEKIIQVKGSSKVKAHKRKIKVGIIRDLDYIGDKTRSHSGSTTDYDESVRNVNDYIAKLHESDESKKVLESVRDYTLTDYSGINNYMKNPLNYSDLPKDILEKLKNKIFNIKKFIKDAPKFEGEVYRGLQYRTNDSESKQRWETFIKNVEESKEMKFGSFISTSESKMVGVNFATKQHYGSNMKSCLITIKTKSGVSIEKLSQVESEHEVLLNNDKTYKIVKFEKQDERNHFLDLEEI